MPRVYSPVWNALRGLTKISFDVAAVVAATKRVARLRKQGRGRRTRTRPVDGQRGHLRGDENDLHLLAGRVVAAERMLMSAQDMNSAAPCS